MWLPCGCRLPVVDKGEGRRKLGEVVVGGEEVDVVVPVLYVLHGIEVVAKDLGEVVE